MRAHDLGNDVPCLLHGHHVPDANVALTDKLQVVQRCTRDRGSRKTNGREHGRRRQHTRPAHRNRDVQELGLLLLGRKLIGHRPARGVRSLTESTSVGKIVDLHNHAVNIVGQTVAQSADLPNVRTNALGTVGHRTML